MGESKVDRRRGFPASPASLAEREAVRVIAEALQRDPSAHRGTGRQSDLSLPPPYGCMSRVVAYTGLGPGDPAEVAPIW